MADYQLKRAVLYRLQAAECRQQGAAATSPAAKDGFEQMAVSYDLLAQGAERMHATGIAPTSAWTPLPSPRLSGVTLLDLAVRAERYKDKAEECRVHSESLQNQDARRRFLEMAAVWEQMARDMETLHEAHEAKLSGGDGLSSPMSQPEP